MALWTLGKRQVAKSAMRRARAGDAGRALGAVGRRQVARAVTARDPAATRLPGPRQAHDPGRWWEGLVVVPLGGQVIEELLAISA